MLLIISPAKTMDQSLPAKIHQFTRPVLIKKAEFLVKQMKRLSVKQLAELLKINPNLAQVNYERYQQWHLPFDLNNARPSIYTFKGEVFHGLEAERFSTEDILYAQDHLRIMSGLYGVLKPLDLIQPYRLDVADPFFFKEQNLYQFWKKDVTNNILEDLTRLKSPVLINLASNEYFKILDTKRMTNSVITPVFKESKGNEFKIVTMYAKKARGLMARFIIQNRIENPEQMKLFDSEGYFFNVSLSSETEFVFTR
ncbi:MAG: peroxide stress protein YaaA [Bacteroidales bacterium]|nr:peroxide stress protein YaaA [Bacteroidales bacterium]